MSTKKTSPTKRASPTRKAARAQKASPAKILAAKAAELERVREGVEMSYGGDQREATGELTVVDNHPADTADYVHERELHDTTQGILDREAEQVREAQERIAHGQYGICADCGNKIPDARMKARPEATLCIECQTRRESPRVA